MSHEVWEEYYDRLAALDHGAPDDADLREHAAAWRSGSRGTSANGSATTR